MSMPLIYKYNNSLVHVFVFGDDIWLVLKEIAQIMGYRNQSHIASLANRRRESLKQLREMYLEMGIVIPVTWFEVLPPGTRLVSESDLRNIFISAHKGKKFREWVLFDLLPKIKKEFLIEDNNIDTPKAAQPTGVGTTSQTKEAPELVTPPSDIIPSGKCYLTVEQIMLISDATINKINMRLHELGLHEHKQGKWQPTDLGKSMCIESDKIYWDIEGILQVIQ